MAYSAEKRGSSDADQFLLSSWEKFKQEELSTEISIRDPENKSEVFKTSGTDESSSKGQENAASSRKRKHSRWDATLQADEQNVDDDVAMTKGRKTRWAGDDSQLKMLYPIHMPDSVDVATDAARKGKIHKMKLQLRAINRKLQSYSIEELESDAELHEKLANQKRCIIENLIRNTPAFSRKLYIPVKEYPECNFIRRILGIRGENVRRLEEETGARIMVRGKGAPKRQGAKPDPSDKEDLCVIVWADSRECFDAAVAIVERLLDPAEDTENAFKHSQLRKLDELNDTLRGEGTHKTGNMASEINCICDICGDAGHYRVACPFSGRLLQTIGHENNVDFPAACGGGLSTFTGPSSPGHQPLDFRPAVHTVPTGSDKFNRDVDYTNLCVANLPQYVDVNRLVHLFSPFGQLSYVEVIKDRATGISKGYGFVRYINPTSATMAVNQMNGYRLDGNMLVVRGAGMQHGTPESMQPAEHTSIRFPPACPSTFATAPAPTCWRGPSISMLPETSDPMCSSYGSSYTGPEPSSLTSTLNATSEELVQFPPNPDYFASGYSSRFL